MNAQFVIGAAGFACLCLGFLMGRRSWLSPALMGIGLGSSFYAAMLWVTDDPLGFFLDFVERAAG